MRSMTGALNPVSYNKQLIACEVENVSIRLETNSSAIREL